MDSKLTVVSSPSISLSEGSEKEQSGKPATVNILGVGGSMRRRSFSTRALDFVLNVAQSKYGANTKLLSLREARLPIYDPDLEQEKEHEEVRRTAEVLNWADAFILATPDYHGSMSGAMKNFLDHFWREFSGKTFGYIVSSHEKGLTVMDHMRTVARQCYGWSMPYGVSINGEQDLDPDSGEITNSRLLKRINMLARDISVYGRLIKAQYMLDLNGEEQATFAAHFR